MALKEDLIEYLRHKLTAEEADKAMKQLKPELMEAFARAARSGKSKVVIETPWWKGHATYVAPGETPVIDPVKLRELLDDESWEMVTEATVNPTLLQAAVDLKKISADVVKACMSTKPRQGFPKYTGHPIDVEPIEVHRDAPANPVRIVGRRKVTK